MQLRFKILFIFLSILVSGAVNAQRIKATASLDSANILIGDQVKLFLEIDHPKNVKIEFPQVPDTINSLIEVLSRSGIDTFELDDENFQKQIQAYTITCFDSGSYRIPPYWFKINMDGNIDSIPGNGVSLHVHSMQIDTTKGLTDIKMPYGAPLTLKEVTPYILGVILIGAIIFLILYSIKRKKNNKPIFARPQKPKEPAHIVAIRELDRIKAEKIWQKGKTKQYYSEVTDALRVYIEDRFKIRAMEQTSDETIENFRVQKGLLNEKHFTNLSQVLKLADLVKFAKYKPLPDDDNLSLVNAYFFVNDTKKEEPKKIEGGVKGEDEDENVEEVIIK
ncbi:MAG: FeoB-associated Cys-rich membrane protein [Bacteroidota bacterium]